jgi:NADH:ubiquinone oxidoreductase subunit 3 (subunit A)
MKNILLYPPLAFIVILVFSALLSILSSKLAFKGSEREGKCKPYACGEDVQKHRLQPDYSHFFPFAFFFTIMHVVALILTTAPSGDIKISGNCILFLLVALSGLFILFRKEE